VKRFPVTFIIIICMVTTSCGPGQLIGPTHPPTPTSTITPTSTPTSPTSTLTQTPTDTPSPTAVSTTVLSNITAISAGYGTTCALTSVGEVKCWGGNASGELGDGTTIDRTIPEDVYGLTSGVNAISAGYMHTCALTSGGGVKCWGDNASGELGDGTTTNRLTPVDVSGLTSGVSAISAGGDYTCALTSGGGVLCWGNNGAGDLGDGTTNESNMPVDVSGLTSGVSAISAGDNHTCALTSGGGVKCWGDNTFGELGDGTTTNRLTPVDVSGLTSGVRAISVGVTHTCVLTYGGGVKCWGDNLAGDLGDGTTNESNIPVDVSGLTSGVSAISAGDGYTCVLTSAGGVECWGDNYYGELGYSMTTYRFRAIPFDVSGLTSGVGAISAGGYHTCALTSVGGFKCWGDNYSGELGNGTTNEPTPAPIPTLGAGQSITFTDLQMINASVGWGSDSNGHIVRTTNGGRSWKDVTPPNLPANYGSFFLDAQSAWMYDGANPEDYLMHTADGGKTWTQLVQSPPTVSFEDVSSGPWGVTFDNERDGWAESEQVGGVPNEDKLYGTHDSGVTWKKIMLSDPPDSDHPSLVPGDLSLCGECGDTVYYDLTRMIVVRGDYPGLIPNGSVNVSLSTDSGRIWKDQTLPLPGPAFVGDTVLPLQPVFFDGNDGLLPFEVIKHNPDGPPTYVGLAVYATHDGGLTWIPNPTVLGDVRRDSIVDFVSMQDIFADCGSDLCATQDGAHTWQPLHSNLNFDTDVTAIDFVSPSTGWALKTTIVEGISSNYLWETTNGGATWTQLSPTVIP